MTKLVWDQEGQRSYEFGVDHGVYYSSVLIRGAEYLIEKFDFGVVWNGLISIEEESVGGGNSEYHFDGVKYLDTVAPRNYQATLTAYSTPYDFHEASGNFHLIPGFILTRQARNRFGLSYRTFVGESDYKIHLIYNALASPISIRNSTKQKSGSAEEISWKIDAVPMPGYKYRPSAHYILDSATMNPEALIAIESIIYGTDTTTARLPTMDELLGTIGLWAPVLIGSQTIPGLAELGPGVGDLTPTIFPGFYSAPSQTRLYEDYFVDGLYRLEA